MSSGTSGAPVLGGRPTLTPANVAAILQAEYGIEGVTRPLPSDRDQNFLIAADDASQYVAKIANSAEDPEVLDLQCRAMAHVTEAGITCPVPVPGRDGALVRRIGNHLFWVVTFLGGDLMAARQPRSEVLLTAFGSFLGTLTRALSGFEHPAAGRELQWDVTRSGRVVARYLPEVEPSGAPLIERALNAYENLVAPALDDLPRSVIHNDANDHNVLVDGDAVTGIIDFGDMVHSVTLNELAVGATYAVLEQPDPIRALDAVTGGYAQVAPLSARERGVLPELVRTRLATSIAISSHQHALEPANDYLVISQKPAWQALAILDRHLHHD